MRKNMTPALQFHPSPVHSSLLGGKIQVCVVYKCLYIGNTDISLTEGIQNHTPVRSGVGVMCGAP